MTSSVKAKVAGLTTAARTARCRAARRGSARPSGAGGGVASVISWSSARCRAEPSLVRLWRQAAGRACGVARSSVLLERLLAPGRAEHVRLSVALHAVCRVRGVDGHAAHRVAVARVFLG